MASNDLKEVLPKTGLLHHEATYNFVLCKPKIMPLKSITLEKLEKMQKEAQELVRDQVRQMRMLVMTRKIRAAALLAFLGAPPSGKPPHSLRGDSMIVS